MSVARFVLPAAALAVAASAQLTVKQTSEAVTVSSTHRPGWSATIDLKRGGAITGLHIPQSGPNLVNRGSSFFNLFAMTSEQIDGRTIKAWSSSNGRIAPVKVERTRDSVTVTVTGSAMSKRNETFFDYRHAYTFRPGGVTLDGEALWRFPKTSMTDSSMGFDAAADTYFHPVRILSGGKAPVELEVTTSSGSFFPDGVGYPMDAEFRLRNGHAFLLRALEVPETYRSNPRHIYEKPWQASWAGRWYWEGDADGKNSVGDKPARYAAGQPFRYRYELAVDPERKGNEPPQVVIVSPVRDSRYYHVGDTVVLKGQAVDREDGRIPADRLRWEVFGTAGKKKVIQAGSGSTISFTFPPDTKHNQDYCQFAIKLSTKDSQGAEGIDYMTLGATPPFPPSPVITGVKWDFAERMPLGKADVATIALASQGKPPAVKPSALPSSPGVVTGAIAAGDAAYALVTKRPGLPPTVGLAASQDAGAHWTLTDFQFPEGAPFYPLIFTEGSADDYFYMWGSTWPKGTNPCHTCRSAYLARVPHAKAADRSAWEFFSYMSRGKPLWAQDPLRNYDSIADADGADVVAATYNAALKRYLIVLATGSQYRLLDAPQPWGGYTTVATMKTWGDVKPGANLKLTIPSKWISPDGRTIWAAYSDGRATWLVRGTLTLKEESSATPPVSGQLKSLVEGLPANRTDSLLLVKGDRVICEWYGEGFTAQRPHGTASLAKAMVGSISLMLAVADGRVALDEPVSKFIPQWRGDPKKSMITFRQLATHTSGLEDSTDNAEGKPEPGKNDWKGDFWKRLDPPRDPFTLSRNFARVVREPGTKLPPGDDSGYSNAGFAMLSYAVSAAYRGTPDADLRRLLRDRVLRPIGVEDDDWSIGYNRTFEVDGLPLVANWGGANFTARATAAVGRLMLHRGNWNGKQIIPEKVVTEMTRNGVGWWVAGKPKSLPADAFIGAGAGIELLVVMPGMDAVMVRYGKNAGKDWANLDTFLMAPIMEVLREQPR